MVVVSMRWLVITQFISQIVRIIVTIYVIRHLENQHMGFVALAQTITSFLEMFSTLGLNTAIISKPNLTRRDIANISGMVILLNLSLAALVFAMSGVLADFYSTPELVSILKFMSLGFVLSGFASVPIALMTKGMRFKEISIIQVCASIAGALSSFYLVNNGFLYWSIIGGGLVYIGVRSLMSMAMCGDFVMPRFSLTETRDHLNFGGYVMLGGLAWYTYTSLDVIIAGRFWSPELLGIYAVAVQLIVMPLNRISPLLKQVALPAFSMTMVQNKQKFEPYLVKSLKISMGICLPLYLGMSAVALVLVPVVLGETWVRSALPLVCLCFAAPFRLYLELLTPPTVASGQPRQVLVNNLRITGVLGVCFLLSAGFFRQPLALALVWMLVYPALSLWVSRGSCRVMEVDYRRIVGAFQVSAINSLVMWVVVQGFVMLAGNLIAPWLVLLLAILLGIGVFMLLTWFFDRSLLKEFSQLMKTR